ncbi:MAG: alpha-amylase [Lachnospiraceae bacterium]|nr:alpha-amylase [Lachnospiraceae bacterium]
MAVNTYKNLRNQVMYSVFVRNYSPEGTFEALRRDLDRICGLGVDIIWLLPIHPIGEKCRKGSLGSPYAIKDYRGINPEYGTLEDFKRLIDDIHKRGMKCIIDVVYNHTSPDSWLAENHPEWFYHKPDGSFGNRIADWYDVIDLDYSQQELWDYQIETLKQWAAIVDGFRCDVAPLIPLEFWLRARKEVAQICPDCIWLSESVEPFFITEGRADGLSVLSDSEIFQAFDIAYDYDIFDRFRDYHKGKAPLSRYAESINQQEYIYPANYVKLRYLENHDNPRAAFIIPDRTMLINWTAFIYFQKGMTLIYAGQEVEAAHRPDLFDKDTIIWDSGRDLSELLQRLGKIKKNSLVTDSKYEVNAFTHDIIYAVHHAQDHQLSGIFSMRGESALVPVNVPDGRYINLVDGSSIEVYEGKLPCHGKPIIFEV